MRVCLVLRRRLQRTRRHGYAAQRRATQQTQQTQQMQHPVYSMMADKSGTVIVS